MSTTLTSMNPKTVRSNQPTHFKVVTRNCEAWEPCWVVVKEGSGQSTDAVGHFFNQFDAESYAKWRNDKRHKE